MKKVIYVFIFTFLTVAVTYANFKGDLNKAGIDTDGTNITVKSSGIIIEGATSDAYETTITVTDPTADRTITLPNTTGTVLLDTTFGSSMISGTSIAFEGTANDFETTITATDPAVDTVVTIPSGATGSVVVSSLATNAPDVVNSVWTASNGIVAEGSVADGNETTISFTNPTGARTITVPDQSGTIITTAGGTVAALAVTGALTTGNNIGAVAGTGVTVVELGDGVFHKAVFTLVNTPVVLVDNAGVTAYGALKIYDFPEGYLYTVGASADLAVTLSAAGVNADFDGDIGLGTVAADNGATPLASTEQNIIPNTATPQAVAGVTTADCVSTSTEHAIIDGHSTASDLYINMLVDDADHDVTSTPTNLILNGTITVLWTSLGDN